MAKTAEVRLGQLLIQKRWCNLRQVNEGLEYQKRLREEGEDRALGWILLEKGYLEEEKLKIALSQLGTLRLTCADCQVSIPLPNYDAEAVYRCPKCQGDLMLTDSSFSTRAPKRETDAAKTLVNVVEESALDLEAQLEEIPSTDLEDPILGKMIGGCQILSRIAHGGMGVVYKARQMNLGRSVAVKVLTEELAKDRNYVRRFLQEARSAAVLNHGNIVHIIDVGELNGLFYIIMEYVDGSNLREILETHTTLDPDRVLEIALQASHALRHAHQRGVIHRDIKPENIMITREGVVKIADLGLAKKMAQGNQDGGITNAGAILGTPFYMAPEQIKDFRQVDGRSDIYSLGVTLFRALAGRVPFEGRTPVEVMIKVVEGKRPALRDLKPEIPEVVQRLVERMIDRSPDDRFQDFDEAIREVEMALRRVQDAKAHSRSTSPESVK